MYRCTLPQQCQIKLDTVLSYLSAIKSYHIDRRQSFEGFDNPRMTIIIKREGRLFSGKKPNCLPITKDILVKITEEGPCMVTDLNIDAESHEALIGFMRMTELTYTAADAKKAMFSKTDLARSHISVAEGAQYVVSRLKQSKTDTDHTGVQIILAATNKQTCPLAALKRLFIQDPCSSNAPLFRF